MRYNESMASGSSLSSVAASGRKFVIYAIAFLIVFTLGRVGLRFAVQTYQTLNPPPTPGPTMGFGYLPSPAFPSQLQEDRPSEYEIGSIGGRFPSFNTQIAVYFMPSATPNLVAFDLASEKASNLGFVLAPEKVTADVYRWRRPLPLPSTLEMNIVTGTLDLEVDWASSVTLLTQRNLPSPEGIRGRSRDLMRLAGVLQADIATAEPQLTYVKALAGETRMVSSLSEADFIQAEFFRVGPQGVPTISSGRDKGVVSFLFSGSQAQGENILRFTSQYYPVQWDTFHTYPMISAQTAYDLLRAGEGYVTTPLPTGQTKAVIRNVYLAYYEPSQPQNYYQPVYVFDGDNNFRALVPALNPQVFQTE